ncbi:uncharacterized protein LOC105279393 [Ooceraea biroi]|uniref:uncharacterized protein LOC105279393 n=1 Tax=Ooceraea biroi TaxID=2015173 RepID=UPI000F074AF6|nr:uncharacterized protein LOC105279393 [Ooceraea biroi]
MERLHYLRSCVQGPAEQLIRSLPMTGDLLQASWDLFIARYENKRLIIQAHLDNLFNLSMATLKNAVSLIKLISTVSESNKALQSLEMTQDMWDCILVHHVSRYLDRDTREVWETSLGSSQTYPRFSQLDEFLNSRARALERIEAASSQPGSSKGSISSLKSTASSSKTPTKRVSAHQASAQTHSSKVAYPCDMCLEQHFIVTCTKFRDLMPAQRRDVAVDKRLCYNCLGRYNIRSCKSSLSCKMCSVKHHTMLHVPQTTTELARVHSSVATHETRLLVDHGSELTFVSEHLTKQLNLQRQHSTISIIGIGGKKTTQTKGMVTLTLHSNHSNSTATIHANVLKTLTTILPSFAASQQTWPHIEKLNLADPEFLIPRPIDIIIGANSYGLIIKHSATMPIAQLSIFGWLILGPVRSNSHSSSCQDSRK